MEAPTIKTDHCVVCGTMPANNQHHLVKRSAGELYVNGIKQEKPTITLCGSGTTGCHGLAHENKLHFRFYQGRLQYALFDKPTPYLQALSRGVWHDLPDWR